jgi:hypothetical protein
VIALGQRSALTRYLVGHRSERRDRQLGARHHGGQG